jgi:hypothetical protein
METLATREEPQMPRPDAVGLSVSPATREAVRRLAGQLTADTGARITLDAAIMAAVGVATASMPATVAALRLPGREVA